MKNKTYFYWRDNDLFLEVYVQPNASKNKIIGMHGDKLKISVKTPPIDSKANIELVNFLAQILGIPKKQIFVAKGLTARNKLIAIKNAPKNQKIV